MSAKVIKNEKERKAFQAKAEATLRSIAKKNKEGKWQLGMFLSYYTTMTRTYIYAKSSQTVRGYMLFKDKEGNRITTQHAFIQLMGNTIGETYKYCNNLKSIVEGLGEKNRDVYDALTFEQMDVALKTIDRARRDKKISTFDMQSLLTTKILLGKKKIDLKDLELSKFENSLREMVNLKPILPTSKEEGYGENNISNRTMIEYAVAILSDLQKQLPKMPKGDREIAKANLIPVLTSLSEILNDDRERTEVAGSIAAGKTDIEKGTVGNRSDTTWKGNVEDDQQRVHQAVVVRRS